MHFYGLVRTMFLDFKYFVILIWCYCLFVFVAGGGEGGGIWYFIQLQCTHSKVKFKGNPQCSHVRSFVLVIKNNEAVLVIKWSAAPTTKWPARKAKTQISLGWPESSLSDWRKFRSLSTHTAHNDSDQTVRMSRLMSLRCAHVSFCLFCLAQAQM